MPVSFAIADDDVIAIVSDIKQKYHHNLHAAGVRIGVLMAESEDEEAASVTHGGYPALGDLEQSGEVVIEGESVRLKGRME